jgi:spore maturation protein CgeB
MKLVIFGLTISSSWGNGHATLWRGLCRALAAKGHRIVFFERDVPYYAGARDYTEIPMGELILYPDWGAIRHKATQEIADADVAMVTSYCPDAIAATRLVVNDGRPRAVFYDLDSPITLSRVRAGEAVEYIGSRGFADFDLVLSYAGGKALDQLRSELGARRTAPLYGHVDPDVHCRVAPVQNYCADLSYLGTFSMDRQAALEACFLAPARQRGERRFVIGGAQYPADFPWSDNIHFVRHLPPSEHPAFYSSSRITLNLTRRAMAELGWCPSGRLFEAAACGVPILSDGWEGLDSFFAPKSEILVAHSSDDAIDALDLDTRTLSGIGKAARERVFAEHTSARRADQLIELLTERPTQPASTIATAWGQ